MKRYMQRLIPLVICSFASSLLSQGPPPPKVQALNVNECKILQPGDLFSVDVSADLSRNVVITAVQGSVAMLDDKASTEAGPYLLTMPGSTSAPFKQDETHIHATLLMKVALEAKEGQYRMNGVNLTLTPVQPYDQPVPTPVAVGGAAPQTFKDFPHYCVQIDHGYHAPPPIEVKITGIHPQKN